MDGVFFGPDLHDLLNRLRGVMVRIKTTAQDWDGRVLGVERKQEIREDVVVTKDTLNLYALDGIKSVALNDVQGIEIRDGAVSADLQKALEVLAGSGDRSKKGVKLDFAGKGHRTIRVGYMVEVPLWKTSYRLVIKDNGGLFLQGWAHVENTTRRGLGPGQALAGRRPPALVHPEPVRSAVHPAPGRRNGDVRRPGSALVRGADGGRGAQGLRDEGDPSPARGGPGDGGRGG